MNGNDSETMRRLPCICRAADRVLWFDEVDSTNAVARRLLSEAWRSDGGETAAACAGTAGAFDSGTANTAAAPPIAAIVADIQTAGHGRLGRQWVSRPGESSMVSFVTVLPQSLATDPRVNGWLQMIAGLAAVEAIDDACAQVDAACMHLRSDESVSHATADADGQASCRLMLKWPNDVFLHDRKLGGILLELVLPCDGVGGDAQSCRTVPCAGPMVGVVFGIGLNLAIPADRLPTELSTSLQLHRAPLPEPMRMRDLIAARMAVALRSRLRAFVADPEGCAAVLHDEMRPICWTIGRRVEARLVDGGVVRGTAVRLNADASLVVCDDDGREHRVTTGDVGVM